MALRGLTHHFVIVLDHLRSSHAATLLQPDAGSSSPLHVVRVGDGASHHLFSRSLAIPTDSPLGRTVALPGDQYSVFVKILPVHGLTYVDPG